MGDIDVTVHPVGLQVDPVQLKAVLDKVMGIAESIAALSGNVGVAATLKGIDAFITQDWFLAMVVSLLAIPDHLKPAAAEAMKAQLVGFQG